jgi:hypothetical protein
MTHDAEAPKDTEILDGHNELDSTMEQDTTTMKVKMEKFLQNPQQCAKLMQLYITRIEVLTLLPEDLRLRIAPAPPMEEEVETRSNHSTTTGIPLQT